MFNIHSADRIARAFNAQPPSRHWTWDGTAGQASLHQQDLGANGNTSSERASDIDHCTSFSGKLQMPSVQTMADEAVEPPGAVTCCTISSLSVSAPVSDMLAAELNLKQVDTQLCARKVGEKLGVGLTLKGIGIRAAE